MIKDLIGGSLILIGIIELGNFFAHHSSNIPLNDYKSHALAGLAMCVAGVFLLKTNISIRDNWTKF